MSLQGTEDIFTVYCRENAFALPSREMDLIENQQQDLGSPSKLNYIELCINEVDGTLKDSHYYATESEQSWKFPHLKFPEVDVENYVSSIRNSNKSSDDQYKALVEVLIDRLNFGVRIITQNLKDLINSIDNSSPVVKREQVEQTFKYWHSTRIANDLQMLFENLLTVKSLLKKKLQEADSEEVSENQKSKPNPAPSTDTTQRTVLKSFIISDEHSEPKCDFDIRFNEIFIFVKNFFQLLAIDIKDFKPSILEMKMEKYLDSGEGYLSCESSEIFCKIIESDFKLLLVYINQCIALDSSHRDMKLDLLELEGRLEEELKNYECKTREKESIISKQTDFKLTVNTNKKDRSSQTDQQYYKDKAEALEKRIDLYKTGENILSKEICEIRSKSERLREENGKLEELIKNGDITIAIMEKGIFDDRKRIELQCSALDKKFSKVNSHLDVAHRKFSALKGSVDHKNEIIKNKNAEILDFKQKVADQKQLIQDMLFNPDVGEPEPTVEEPKSIRETLKTQIRVNAARISALEDMNNTLTRTIQSYEKSMHSTENV